MYISQNTPIKNTFSSTEKWGVSFILRKREYKELPIQEKQSGANIYICSNLSYAYNFH